MAPKLPIKSPYALMRVPPIKPFKKSSNTVIQKKLPTVLSLSGHRERGGVKVLPAGKPPKLRFQIGTYLRYEGQLYEVLYAFRLRAEPHEWIYCLEERETLDEARNQPNASPLHGIIESMGAGQNTPRIVYEIFQSETDATTFFWDIPGAGDRMSVRNKNLIKKATVVSSGSVVGAEEK